MSSSGRSSRPRYGRCALDYAPAPCLGRLPADQPSYRPRGPLASYLQPSTSTHRFGSRSRCLPLPCCSPHVVVTGAMVQQTTDIEFPTVSVNPLESFRRRSYSRPHGWRFVVRATVASHGWRFFRHAEPVEQPLRLPRGVLKPSRRLRERCPLLSPARAPFPFVRAPRCATASVTPPRCRVRLLGLSAGARAEGTSRPRARPRSQPAVRSDPPARCGVSRRGTAARPAADMHRRGQARAPMGITRQYARAIRRGAGAPPGLKARSPGGRCAARQRARRLRGPRDRWGPPPP